MENGGNAKVNAVFEARLSAAKPGIHADGPTRERFIRDKYERRKFYDPAAFSNLPVSAPAAAAPHRSQSLPVQPPSEAARQRMESRRGRLQKSHSDDSVASNESTSRGRRGAPRRTESSASKGSSRGSVSRTSSRIAKAPVSAPVDLLDFGSDSAGAAGSAFGTSGNNNSSSDPFADFLGSSATTAAATQPVTSSVAPSGNTNKNASADIMSLYGNMNSSNNNNFMMNQMTAQMGHMNVNQNISAFPSGMVGSNMMFQNGSNGVMQQMSQQFVVNPGYNNAQQNFGSYQQQMQMSNNSNKFGGFSSNGDTDFGSAPMGSGPPLTSMQPQSSSSRKKEKEDPFAQFGMNAFR